MHILLLADGRSPITLQWLKILKSLDVQVSLITTFPCVCPEGLQEFHVLSFAFAGLGGSQATIHGSSKKQGRSWVKQLRKFLVTIRALIAPMLLSYTLPKVRSLVQKINPDLVHALRIPFEGMLAVGVPVKIPLVISIWGNDLTLHARRTAAMRLWTRRALYRANGLLADTHRDIRLAGGSGFRSVRPTLVVPGGGGIDIQDFRSCRLDPKLIKGVPKDARLIINPRGMRLYVRNDTFFKAIPKVLELHPEAYFVCPSMAGQPQAEAWLHRLHIEKRVMLLPDLPQRQLWALFRKAEISISVSEHDGTPNSLLEAMAAGCLPVVGDLESLREWITPGVNGLLVPPDDEQLLADSIILGLEHPELVKSAQKINLDLIKQRANREKVTSEIARFYQQIQNR